MSNEKLAEALFQVFAFKGYASTSISDLTQATGMKPASLYLAFSNKEGMYEAALNYYKQNWLSGLKQVIEDKSVSFEQRIRKFLDEAFTLFSCNETPLGCMMIFSSLAFHSDDNKISCQLRDERLAFVKWLEFEASIAKASGQLPGDITPKEFAGFIITLERGLALSALDRPDPEMIRSMIDKVLSPLFFQKVTDK